MFDNIGDKIKLLAVVLCIIGIILSVISGVMLISTSFLTAVLTIVIGCLASWVGSFCLYGFGELIEDTAANRQINAELLKLMQRQNGGGEASASASDAARRAASVGSYTIPGAKVSVSGSTGESWKCKKCGSPNHRTQQYCANCGEYK